MERRKSHVLLLFLCMELVIGYVHFVIYETIILTYVPGPYTLPYIRWAFVLLGVSFIAMQLVVAKFKNRVFDFLYTLSATWLGTVHFLFLGCIIFWFMPAILLPLGSLPPWTLLGSTIFAIALTLDAYCLVRSLRQRYRRYYVHIKDLPAAWKNRKAIMVADVHLGNVRGMRTIKKLVRMANAENPDIVFLPGDLFDGPPADYTKLASPLQDIQAKHGVYFVEGNHEEFGDPEKYLEGIRAAGVKILDHEVVDVEGMQILGIPFRGTYEAAEMQPALAGMRYDHSKPSILLKHAPQAAETANEADISLMLSGHTHNGQLWPFNWLVRRIFGTAGYGHSVHGNLQVVTTSGFGTWGPPQRFRTRAEMVVITFI